MDRIIKEIEKELNYRFPKNTVFEKVAQGLKVEASKGQISVSYARKCDIMRAGLIIKANEGVEAYCIRENNEFEDIVLMLDCSRNAVRTVDTVKKLIRNLAMMGYNALMLYTEDTYEVKDEPLFGYLRGRYTIAEMKEINEYANLIGVEMIPCIQTLAHLNQLKRYWIKNYNCFDNADILLVGNERTYQLIENMFRTLAECFTTRRVHIGMDEAWLLGRGRYMDENGYKKPFDIIQEHLYKVQAIAEKYGFSTIMWSDMFSHMARLEGCVNVKGKLFMPEKIVEEVPQRISLCHWEYHHLTPEGYTDGLAVHKEFKNPIWFAGGKAWGDRGFLPFLSYSMKVSQAAIIEAKKFGIKHLIETVWGDNGGECSIFALFPAVMHYAYTAREIPKERLEREFKALTGYAFEAFMHLEDGQTFCGKFTDDTGNPAKYGLYSDLFTGYIDAIIDGEDKKYFEQAVKNVENIKDGQYAYLFEMARTLNEVLYIKYDMGIQLRKAYQEGDKEQLIKIEKDMDILVDKLKAFISAYTEQWYNENKPEGLEIQEIRLGGLLQRILGCQKRLSAYCKGALMEIPELALTLEPSAVTRVREGNRCDEFSHIAIASMNSFDGFTDIDI